MMQMCPYLQAAYRCLQQYLCTWVHLVLTGILGPWYLLELTGTYWYLLEFWVHEVLAFWQIGYQDTQHGACSSYLHL